MRPPRFVHAIMVDMRSLALAHSQPDLERAVLEAAENERRRIGQELHDDLCQNLLGAAFTVKAVADKLPPASAEAVELELAVELINAAVQQARDIAHGLHPGELPKRP